MMTSFAIIVIRRKARVGALAAPMTQHDLSLAVQTLFEMYRVRPFCARCQGHNQRKKFRRPEAERNHAHERGQAPKSVPVCYPCTH